MQSSATSKTTAQLSGGRGRCPGLACTTRTPRFLRAGHAHPTTARHVLSAALAPTCAAILALSLGACATQGVQEQQRSQREDSVDQRMLSAQSGGDGGGSIQSYTLAPAQRFRMPRALRSDAPVLPADSPRQSLPPTTVCAHVILTADGAVQRVDPMSDRDECAAGLLPDNADLVQSVRTTVQQWQFVPAALCVCRRCGAAGCAGRLQRRHQPAAGTGDAVVRVHLRSAAGQGQRAHRQGGALSARIAAIRACRVRTGAAARLRRRTA